MSRYLYLSLCLSIITHACSLGITTNFTLTDDDEAEKKAETETLQDDATRTNTPTKKAVIAACLPQINALLITRYGRLGRPHFFLRRSRQHNGTAEAPVVILYTREGTPLEFADNTTSGLGPTVAAVMANLKVMAASQVIQDQFVKREEVHGVTPPGYRIHVSIEATGEGVEWTRPGSPPSAPSNRQIIYDPQAIAAANVNSPAIAADDSPGGDIWGGWYDCAVDETTQVVTAWYTSAITQS